MGTKSTFSEEAHKQSLKARRKLAKLRAPIAKKFNLSVTELYPKNIQKTLDAGKLTLHDLPQELWPKSTNDEVSIPFPPDMTLHAEVKTPFKPKTKLIKPASGGLSEQQLETLAKLIVAVAKET